LLRLAADAEPDAKPDAKPHAELQPQRIRINDGECLCLPLAVNIRLSVAVIFCRAYSTVYRVDLTNFWPLCHIVIVSDSIKLSLRNCDSICHTVAVTRADWQSVYVAIRLGVALVESFDDCHAVRNYFDLSESLALQVCLVQLHGVAVCQC